MREKKPGTYSVSCLLTQSGFAIQAADLISASEGARVTVHCPHCKNHAAVVSLREENIEVVALENHTIRKI